MKKNFCFVGGIWYHFVVLYYMKGEMYFCISVTCFEICPPCLNDLEPEMTQKQFVELKHLLLTREVIDLYNFIKNECDDLIVGDIDLIKEGVLAYLKYCILNSYSPRCANAELVRTYLNNNYEVKALAYNKEAFIEDVIKTFERLFTDFDRKKKNTAIN